MQNIVRQQAQALNDIVPESVDLCNKTHRNTRLASWGNIKNELRRFVPDVRKTEDAATFLVKYITGSPKQTRATKMKVVSDGPGSSDRTAPTTTEPSGGADRAAPATDLVQAVRQPAVDQLLSTFLHEQAQNQLAFMGMMRNMVQHQQQQQQQQPESKKRRLMSLADREQLEEQVEEDIRAKIRGQVEEDLRAEIRGQVEEDLRAEIRKQIEDEMWYDDDLRDEIEKELRVDPQFRDDIKDDMRRDDKFMKELEMELKAEIRQQSEEEEEEEEESI